MTLTEATDLASAVIRPSWPAPPQVQALVTTRAGGVSQGPWRGLNLGLHVGDDGTAVAANRTRLYALLPDEPRWLHQVHGVDCVDAATEGARGARADASFTTEPGVVCAVLTADCLPVLMCDAGGRVVGVAHAGWRGLLAGVIEALVAAMQPHAQGPLLAWLGPAIGPQSFEVGSEVRAAYVGADVAAGAWFEARGDGKYMANLYALARQRLAGIGVTDASGGEECTYRDGERFYSYRRDGVTGRMASCIWLSSAHSRA